MNKEIKMKKYEKPERLMKYPVTEIAEAVDFIPTNHPYCITEKHVAYASEHNGGMLNERAITDAEDYGGAKCGICGKYFKDEIHGQAVLIAVNSDKELKEIPELKDFLLACKEHAEQDKVKGFAFIKRAHFIQSLSQRGLSWK